MGIKEEEKEMKWEAFLSKGVPLSHKFLPLKV